MVTRTPKFTKSSIGKKPMHPRGSRITRPGVDADDVNKLATGSIEELGGVASSHPAARAARNSISREAAEIAAEEAPSVMDRVVGGTNSFFERVWNLDFIVVMPVMLASGAIRGIGWALGKITPSSWGIGDKVSHAGETLYRPVDIYQSGTLGKAGKVLERATGLEVNSAVGKGAQRVADGTAHILPTQTRLTNWLAGRQVTKAGNALTKAKALAGKLDISQLSSELHTHVDVLKNAANAAHHSHVDTEGVREAVTILQGHSGKLGEEGAHFLEHMSDVVHHGGMAKGLGNLKDAMRNAPAALSKAPIHHTVTSTAFIGASALGTYGVARGFTQQLTSLRHMYADITGKDYKDVSSREVLFGSVPGPIAEARSQLLKSSGAQALAALGNLGLNIKMATSRKTTLLSAVIQGAGLTLLPMAASLMPNTVVPVYDAVRKAHASGQKIPAEFYAEFIGTASPELRARGGAQNAFTKEIAKQYEAENAAPGQIMREIANGKLMERINTIAAANAAATPQAPAGAPQISHVDRLNGKGAVPQPTVGQHTSSEQLRRTTVENTQERGA